MERPSSKITLCFFLLGFLKMCAGQECENGRISTVFLHGNFSEDQCLAQQDHCFHPIDETFGYCLYNGLGEHNLSLAHPDLECTFRERLYFDLRFTDEFLGKTFPDPQEFPSLADALNRCSELQCSWLVIDSAQATHLYYIVTEPLNLMAELADLNSTSPKSMLSYFEPRCYFSNGTVSTRQDTSLIEELCRNKQLPSTDAFFDIEYDTSELLPVSLSSAHQCSLACDNTRNCQSWAFYRVDSACRIWKEPSDSPSSQSNPRCVIRSSSGKIFSKSSGKYLHKHGVALSLEDLLVTFGRQDTNKCWDNCAKDPECTVAAIADQLCYTFRTTTNNPSAGLTAAEIFVMRDKIFGGDDRCDSGEATLASVSLNYNTLDCRSHGMCHKNIGTPESSVPMCYHPKNLKFSTTSEGKKMSFSLQLRRVAITKTFILRHFPESSVLAVTYKKCIDFCYEKTCFALAFDFSDSTCNLATTPFPFDYQDSPSIEPDTDYLIGFVKYESAGVKPVEELCKDQEELPPNWKYGSALLQPHTVEDATTYEECIQKCILDEAGSCNRVIFRPQDQKCLIFGSIEVFLQDLEPTSSPPVNPNGQQCITEPIDGGLFKPKSITHAPRDASLEPREKHFVQIDFSTERNECWEYCSQLPWCQSVHIRMTGECLFYDREETTLETDTLLTDQIILSKKVFADENFCNEGGLVTNDMFQRGLLPEATCRFLQLCYYSQSAYCYERREKTPEPIKVTSNCHVQPVFTSPKGSMFDGRLLEEGFPTVVPEITTYEACVQHCSLNENCLGVMHLPSQERCTIVTTNQASNLKRNHPIENRQQSEHFFEAQVALEIPKCPQCVRRVVMQEQIVFKDELQCTHTLQESCSEVYKTIFKTQEVEECKESFVKNCHIEYQMVPRTEKVEVCHSPLARNCNEEGPEVCSTEYETVCATTYHENEVTDDVANCTTVKEDVCDPKGENCRKVPKQSCRVESVASKKLTPEIDCRQEAREVCGPEICPIVQRERVCADELKTFVQEVPQEKCEIAPKKVCDMVHKIVPKLEMNQECIDVPQEICEKVQVEVKKEKIPIVKEWCPSSPEDSAGQNEPSVYVAHQLNEETLNEDMSADVDPDANEVRLVFNSSPEVLLESIDTTMTKDKSSENHEQSMELRLTEEVSSTVLPTLVLLEDLAIPKRGSRGN